MKRSCHTELNHQAIRAVVQAARNSDDRQIREFGLTPEIVAQLSKLSMEELETLTEFNDSVVKIYFDSHAVALLLQHVSKQTVLESDINKAIRLGARQPMLYELTGLSRRDFARRCRLLQLPLPQRGRIRTLRPEEEEQLYELWYKNRNMGMLSRYIRVAEETGLPLDRIWSALQEAED